MSVRGIRVLLKKASSGLDEIRSEEARRKEAGKAVRSGGKLSLYDFVRASWTILEPDNPFKPTWHVQSICEHLEAVSALEIKSLIINLPPRMGKSLLVSVFWFAWTWTLNPYSRWVFASYGENLAHRDATKSRDVVTSRWYQDQWGDKFKLRGDQNAKEKIQNDKQGFRIATTVAGRALGEGGNFFVVDDPLKVEESESPNARQKVIDWWTGTVSTRGNDPKTFRRVVVQQRLHERDLSGYLMAEVGGYEQLVIPAEYEPRRYWLPDRGAVKPKDAIIPTKVQLRSKTASDPRTEEGELLWPARFGREQLEQLKKELRHRAAGQLQQRPSDPEGSIFRRSTFRTFYLEERKGGAVFVLPDPTGDGVAKVVPVAACRFFQTADTAQKIKKRNDYTAVCTAALAPGGFLLILDVYQCKLESPHLMKFMRAIKVGPVRWDAANLIPVRVGRWPGKVFRQYVEDASSGSGLLQTAAVELNPMARLSAAGDKGEKAAVLATLYEAGRVYHLAGGVWSSDTEEELCAFPSAAHDDRTDAMGSAARVSVSDRGLRVGIPNLEEVAEDYPDFQDYKREMQDKVRDADQQRMKDEALQAVGMEPKTRDDPDVPIPATYTINLPGGEVILDND